MISEVYVPRLFATFRFPSSDEDDLDTSIRIDEREAQEAGETDAGIRELREIARDLINRFEADQYPLGIVSGAAPVTSLFLEWLGFEGFTGSVQGDADEPETDLGGLFEVNH